MGIPPEDEDAVSRAERLDRAIASHAVTTEGLYQFPTPHESGAEAAADAADRHASPLEPARVLGMRPSTTVVHDVVNELTVILMAVNELMSGVESEAVRTSRLEDIHAAAQQAATLLRVFTTKRP